MSELDLRRCAIVCVTSGVIAAGCGTAFVSSGGTTSTSGGTTTGSGGGSTTSTSSSTTGGGGAGGSTSVTTGSGGATTTSTTGSGGTGGVITNPCVPGDLSTCPGGQYCDKGSGECTSCLQPNGTASFAAPVPLGISAPYPPLSLFPRIGPEGQLLFRFRTNQNSDIGYALPVPGAAMNWSSAAPEPSPLINSPTSNEEAPLFLPDGASLQGFVSEKVDTGKPVLLFDSNITGSRLVYAANLDGPGAYAIELKTQGTAFQVAVAFAQSPARFWYYSNFFPGPPGTQLVTNLLGDAPTKVPIVLDNGCPSLSELMPWVTPDGQRMFVSAGYPDPASGCTQQPGAPSHLFVVTLDDDGLQKVGTKAQAIFPNDQNNQVSPSLSPDQCTLYFSQIGNQGSVLYGAVRK